VTLLLDVLVVVVFNSVKDQHEFFSVDFRGFVINQCNRNKS